MFEAISAFLGIVATILGYYLKREKTKAQKAEEAAEHANKAVLSIRRKIADGKLYEVQEDMDVLDMRVRALLRMHKKRNASR